MSDPSLEDPLGLRLAMPFVDMSGRVSAGALPAARVPGQVLADAFGEAVYEGFPPEDAVLGERAVGLVPSRPFGPGPLPAEPGPWPSGGRGADGLREQLLDELAFLQESGRGGEWLECMLDELEASIEGTEVAPAWPLGPDPLDDSMPEQDAMPGPSSRPSPSRPHQGAGRPWFPRAPRLSRPGRWGVRPYRPRPSQGRASQAAAVLCPRSGKRIPARECERRECEHRNLDKWLEDPENNDRCSHPDYREHLRRWIQDLGAGEGR
ncbi:MAG: hypothetical protein AB1512_02940 [Thermodesulfobacteriota bacterium]